MFGLVGRSNRRARPGCWIEPRRSNIAMGVKPRASPIAAKLTSDELETRGFAARMGIDQLRHLAPREKQLRGGMSQEHASGALARRSGVGTTIAYSAWAGSRVSNWSLENTRRVMARSFMRFAFACLLPAPVRVPSIANDSFEYSCGINPQLDMPLSSGWRGASRRPYWSWPSCRRARELK